MIKKSWRLVAVVPAIALLAACGGGSGSGSNATGSAASSKTVKIGVTNAQESQWTVFKSEAKKAGINVDLVSFSDYNQPNQALSQGQLDLNEFQHLQFLANYNVKNNDTLTPIGATALFPLNLYSKKYTSVSALPKGAKVAIPNDPTNQARAIITLGSAGLLKAKSGDFTSLSTPADIDTSASKATVVPVNAAQTAQALNSVAAAVINQNYAAAAKISPNSAIYKSDLTDPALDPYINVWVSRAADKDNPTYKKIVDIFHSAPVAAAQKKDAANQIELKTNSASELQTILTKIQDELKNQG